MIFSLNFSNMVDSETLLDGEIIHIEKKEVV